MQYTLFIGANLEDSIMDNIAALGAQFDGAQMSRANLTNARASDASFRDVQLCNAVMTSIVLNGADFTGANLIDASVSGDLPDSLDGVIWSNTICPDGTNSDSNGGTCEGHLAPAPTPTVVLSLSTVVSGDRVDVTAQGFTPFDRVAYSINGLVFDTDPVDASGANTHSVFINVHAGVYMFRAEDQSGVFAETPITITPAPGPAPTPTAVILSPNPVVSGEVLSWTFEGFTPFTAVRLWLGTLNLAAFDSDACGSGFRSFPINLLAGEYTLRTEDSNGVSVETPITVTSVL